MLSPAAGVFETDYNVTNRSHLMIFLHKNAFTYKNWESQERSYKTNNEIEES